MTNLTKFNNLIKTDAADQAAAEKELSRLFGSVSPSRYEASHLTKVLDKSGSMIGEKANQLKAAVRELERQFPDIKGITLAFDHKIQRLDDLNQYHPDGNTALRDSILAAIQVTETEITHDNVMIVIVCDGDDNASTASVADVANAVAEKKALGWQFYAIHIGDRKALSYRPVYEKLGIASITETKIPEAIEKLIQGVYGYLETGKLLLE